MDLYVSGYTSGGFEVDPTIVTPSSNTTVRFDRMNGDLLRIRSHGVSRGDRASMGWRMDMAQGSRGRTGLLDLREAARPFDDGRAFIEVRPYSSGFLSSGLMTVGPRGEGPLHIGPALFADAGGAMGPSISWQLTSALRILGEESGSATQVAAMEARMIGGQWVGPLRLSLEGQSSFATIRMENEETNHLMAWTQSELSLPLVRRFSHVHHLVKPFARGMLLTSRISQEPDRSLQPSAIAQGERWLTVAGTRTSFGPVQDESGMLLELAGGHMGNLNQNGAQRALLGRFELRSGSLGLNAEGAVLSHNGKEGGIGMARTMVGRPHSVGAWFDLSYRSILDPAAVRAFTPSATRLAPVSELDRSGTSIALGGHIPMGLGMRLGATSDWDVGEQKWLAAGTGLEIVHPCNCLHGRAWVSRRVGRGGTDGWVTLEVR